jgi:choline dehydrogenase-like flavoprotein
MLHFTRDENAHRNSTFHAFLPIKLAQERANRLHIVTNTVAHRLIVQKDEGHGSCEVTGVVLQSRTITGGKARTIKAKKEVILCSGPFGSPQLLMLRLVAPMFIH